MNITQITTSITASNVALRVGAVIAFLLLYQTFLAQPSFALTSKAYEAEVDKLFLNAQFGNAQAMCVKAMKENPKDRLIFLRKLGEIHVAVPSSSAGLDACREAMRLAPTDPQILATCAMDEFLAGYVVKSQQLAQEALSINNKNGRAHAALALAGLRDESIPLAEELAKALTLAPKDITILTVAGIIHLRRLEYDQAEASYSLMVKAFPNTALPFYLRGYFRREVFNNNGAIKDLTEVAKHNPNDSYVMSTLAKLNKKSGREKEAIENFNALDKLGGGGYSSFSRRAECYEKLGKLDLAEKDYRKALEAAGVTKPDFLKKFATTMGQTRRSAWSTMMDPKEASILSATKASWLKLIILEEKRGEYAAALKDLSSFTALFPGDLNSLYARHKVYKKTGKWTEALSDLNFLISKNPNVAEYYKSRAEIFKAMKQPDKAAADEKRVSNLEQFGTVNGD